MSNNRVFNFSVLEEEINPNNVVAISEIVAFTQQLRIYYSNIKVDSNYSLVTSKQFVLYTFGADYDR